MSTFQVATKLGTLTVEITSGHSLFFEARENFTVNGVSYRCSGHYDSNGSEWKMANTFSIDKVNSVKYADHSRSAKIKAMECINAAMQAWIPTQRREFETKQKLCDIITKENMELEIAETEKELAKLKAEYKKFCDKI